MDISNLDWNDHIRIRQLVNELSVSCETSGFFYLKVSDEFGQTCIEMLQAAKEVFRVPEDEKVKLINDRTSQMFHKGKCNSIQATYFDSSVKFVEKNLNKKIIWFKQRTLIQVQKFVIPVIPKYVVVFTINISKKSVFVN